MIPESNLTILDAIFKDLNSFSSPYNRDGFLSDFCAWVVREWETRPFYTTEIANFGHDLNHFPRRTDLLLKEKAKTYREFINANNGRHYVTSLPGQGTACETMGKNLYEFFHESMRKRALTFIDEHFPELVADDFWNRIFCEDFEESSEAELAEEISVYFGFYGLAAAPYLSAIVIPIEHERSPFQDWELKDFRKSLNPIQPKIPITNRIQKKRGLELSLGQIESPIPKSLNLNRRGLFRKYEALCDQQKLKIKRCRLVLAAAPKAKALSLNTFKKNLSQSDVFA